MIRGTQSSATHDRFPGEKGKHTGGACLVNTPYFGRTLDGLSGIEFDGYRRCVAIPVGPNIRSTSKIPRLFTWG